MNSMGQSPLHLTATCILQAGSSGIAPNTTALVNPYGFPMEIHEIKWQIRTGDVNYRPLGASTGCSFTLGSVKLTNGFVPNNLFCKSTGMTAGTGSNVNQNLAAEEITDPTANFWNQFSWRLPVPLYVPPGAVLVPKFEHRNLLPSDLNITISYTGTTLPMAFRPKRILVPWVAYWAAKTILLSAADSDNSQETDLANTWPESINIQRMVGRTLLLRNSSGWVSEDGNFGDYQSDLLQVRIVRSDGHHIVPEFSRWSMVFPHQRRSWEMRDAIMAPNSFMMAFIQKAASANAGGGGAADQLTTQSMMSIVGWREVGT